MATIFKKSFGSRLKKKREEAGFTQDDVAAILGKSKKQVISNWENEKNEPKLSELTEMATLYKTTIAYLVDGDESISREKYEELQAKYIALLESKQGGGGASNTQGEGNFNFQKP